MCPKQSIEALQIKQHIKLVVSQALLFKPNTISDFDDFVQVGLIGLLNAIRTFDEKKGPFNYWAKKLIFQSILKEAKQFHQSINISMDNVRVCEQSLFWECIPDNIQQQDLDILQMRADGSRRRG